MEEDHRLQRQQIRGEEGVLQERGGDKKRKRSQAKNGGGRDGAEAKENYGLAQLKQSQRPNRGGSEPTGKDFKDDGRAMA